MRYLLFLVLLLGGMIVAARADDGNAPPQDAMWTINCMSFTGPYRVEMAKRKLAAVKNLTGVKDSWHVVHQEEESTLIYGYYKASPLRDVQGGDPKEAQRAREDLAKIRGLRNTDGEVVFPFSFPAEIPRPGSEGPPEWDLKNTPADRYWSILIGEYRDNPERKKAAVEAVRILRKDGDRGLLPAQRDHQRGMRRGMAQEGAQGSRRAMLRQSRMIRIRLSRSTTFRCPRTRRPSTSRAASASGCSRRRWKSRIRVCGRPWTGTRISTPMARSWASDVKDANGKERLVPDPSLLLIIPHNNTTFGAGDKSADAQSPAPPRLPEPPVPAKPKNPTPGQGKLKSLD